MSVELHVFMLSSRLPSSDRWQAAVAEASLPIELDEAFDPREDSGAWPVKYYGPDDLEDSSFELYVNNRVDLAELELAIREHLPMADKVVTLRVGGDVVELTCAMFAAAALVRSCGGVLWDEAREDALPFDEIVDEARAAARSARSNDYLMLKPTTYARRKPVEVTPYMEGWLQCPGCERRFAMYDPHRWDGERHKMCGQRIVVNEGS